MSPTLSHILQSTPKKTKDELAEFLTDYMLSKQGLGMEEAIEPDVLQKLRNFVRSREENLYELALQIMQGLQNTYKAEHLEIKVLLYDKILGIAHYIQETISYYFELRKTGKAISARLEKYQEEIEAIEKKMAHISGDNAKQHFQKEYESRTIKLQEKIKATQEQQRIKQSCMHIEEALNHFSEALLELLHEPHEPEDIELCSQTIIKAYPYNQNV